MQALQTIPAQFSVPLMFTISHGTGSFFLGMCHCSAVHWSTKFSVAPLSISALAVAIPCACLNRTAIFNKFLWLTYTQSKDKAHTQATWVEPSKKTKTELIHHPLSTCPATKLTWLCSSLELLCLLPPLHKRTGSKPDQGLIVIAGSWSRVLRISDWLLGPDVWWMALSDTSSDQIRDEERERRAICRGTVWQRRKCRGTTYHSRGEEFHDIEECDVKHKAQLTYIQGLYTTRTMGAT